MTDGNVGVLRRGGQGKTGENGIYIYFYFYFFCLHGVSHSKIFHSYRDVTFAGKWLQILTYVRHLWPLSSESSLACQTYYDTGHLFMMVISEICCGWDSNTQPSACGLNALTDYAPAAATTGVGRYEYAIIDIIPVSQEVWHDKGLSLFKVLRC